jgi:mono/diheme cytochrome c family protein
MRKQLLIGAVLTAIAAGTLVLGQPKSAPQTPAPAANPPSGVPKAQLDRGRYLTEVGDCVACHTQQGGERLAGARPVETPFGTLLSANITPDKDTGIGNWNADQFYRAMHEGIDNQGKHLYPAFPYNYYTNVTREDSDAIFAYLRSVPPVHKQFERNKLPFPFKIRQLMIGWNLLFLHKGPYRPDSSKSAAWNRGAYLVQGLGHCEACHTPMNVLGAPKSGKSFHGGRFGEWFAPDITPNKRVGIGAWDDDSLREFLRRGLNVHSSASGEMGEVVAFSTSQMNDADLNAVIGYLRTAQASPDAKVASADAAVMKQGQAIWQDSCSACHQMDAGGVPRYFPPLQHDPNVQQTDPTTLVHFILAGTRKVPTGSAPTPLSMPAFDWKLDDQQVAAVATYVRNSWGNAAQPVDADEVHKLRDKLKRPQGHPEMQPDARLAHPGPNTLAPPGTDSRDNGSAQAGRAAPSQDSIAAGTSGNSGSGAAGSATKTLGNSGPSSADKTSGGSGASGGGGGSGAAAGGGGSGKQEKGHPAGVPTGGPG